MPYKQVFARLYNTDALADQPLEKVFTFLPDGRLSIGLNATPELVDIGVHEPRLSTVVLSGSAPALAATTPDGRYEVEIVAFPHAGTNEYWLIHTDKANGKFKRTKLNTEWRENAANEPRVVVSPGGSFFIVDDSGTVRLYSTPHLVEAGTFQVAHINTENRVIALAVSSDERLIAALSAWKDIVVYNVAERRVMFVRQIRDEIGWYAAGRAHIAFAGDAEVIVTVGVADKATASETPRISVNVFKQVPLTLPSSTAVQ